jgi:hypothetical protein
MKSTFANWSTTAGERFLTTVLGRLLWFLVFGCFVSA